MMEFVFGFIENNDGFYLGYSRNMPSSSNELCLMNLYNLYNILMIIVESKYRKYENYDQDEARARFSFMEEIRKARACTQ